MNALHGITKFYRSLTHPRRGGSMILREGMSIEVVVMRLVALSWFFLCGSVAFGALSDQARRYQEAWYLENGLHELSRAASAYRRLAETEGVEPSLAARALLRSGACYRALGEVDEASKVEVEARRRFPDQTSKLASYRIEVLHKQLDEAFNVAEDATASQAIEQFLQSLDLAAVHRICDWCYRQASEKRSEDPLGSIAALRKAIAISTYLRQIERSAFAQKVIGDIYASLGRYEDAIAAYRKVQDVFPSAREACAWAQMGVAEAQWLRGRLAEAVEAYRAVGHDYPGQLPQVLWSHLWMGEAYRVAGKLADAHAAWRWVLEEFNEPAFANQLNLAARLLGQARPGREVKMPRDEFANDVAYFLAVEQELGGHPERARRYYQRCVQLSKDNDWPQKLAERALGRLAQPK